MIQPDPNQPNSQIGLRNQHSVLHQLYNLTITTTRTRAKLEISWKTLSCEDQREITRRKRQRAGN
jgi:hypothetical protein